MFQPSTPVSSPSRWKRATNRRARWPGVVLTQVPVPVSFRLIMGLGAATALLACAVAAFLPGLSRRTP